MSTASDLWLRRYHPAAPDAPRLVCLPHAGGSASYYFPVSAALSPDVEVIAVQYPGRQERRSEPPAGTIRDLADAVTQVLLDDVPGPLAMFGHSMGATLAFEIGTRLERSGVRISRIFASGRRAPSCLREETVHQRDDDGVIAELRSLNGTDSSLLAEEEILRMVLPAIRADYQAAETYVMPAGTGPLRCPLTVLTGDADPKTTVEEARAWERHTTGPFDLSVFPGGHFFLADQRAGVLALVSERLAVPAAARLTGQG